MKYQLKVLCEECAAGSALRCDDEELNYGIVDFDIDAITYSQSMVNYANSFMPVFSRGNVSIVDFEAADDALHPYVRVKLKYTADADMFRLPFITLTSISHESVYEWIE